MKYKTKWWPKLIALTGLVGLLLPAGFLAKDIPERFQNYKERATYSDTKFLPTPEGMFCVHRYDLDSDGSADVMEMYPAAGPNMHLTTFPISYWFDLDGKDGISDDEVLVDEACDGINGNEYWQDKPKPQPDKLHKNQKGV